jgi:hypothetical protein
LNAAINRIFKIKHFNGMGRPPTRPGKLRDGYYIEVRSKGSKSGIKLRSDTLDEMKQAKLHYEKTKEVIILGQYVNGKPVDDK